MDNYTSTKTVFINKLYEKFYKKNLNTRLIEFNKKYHNENISYVIGDFFLFKNKYYIFEATEDVAKIIFYNYFGGRLTTEKKFFRNFDIQTYEDNTSLEDKPNEKDTVYINKYQSLFFYFWLKSVLLFIQNDMQQEISLKKSLEGSFKNLNETIYKKI